MTLSEATVGKTYKVVKTNGDARDKRRLFDLGLVLGTKITLIHKAPFGGTVLLHLRSYNLSLRGEASSLIQVEEVESNKTSSKTHPFDKIALSRTFALPLFIIVMLLVFALSFGAPTQYVSGILDTIIGKVKSVVIAFFAFLKTPKWIETVFVNGILDGVGSVVSFLPQIFTLLFLLQMLDETGYSARVAFLFDGLLGKIGLSGRTVFTLISGFGCSVTAVMSTRGTEDEGMRKKTVMVAPFVSCSARLPIFALISSVFIKRFKFLFVVSLYFISILSALVFAFIYDKVAFKSKKQSFIMELPDYKLPSIKSVLKKMKDTLRAFVFKIGTIILALNVLMAITTAITLPNGKSLMESICETVAPLFYPLGFGNWKAVSALISGFVAKETVVSSIASLGGIEAVFSGKYAFQSAIAFCVYTLLYTPCLATLSAQIKEIGLKLSLISFAVQLVFSYGFALIVRLMLLRPLWCIAIFAVSLVALLILSSIIKSIKRYKCKKTKIPLTKA